jgi:hypothetical protein
MIITSSQKIDPDFRGHGKHWLLFETRGRSVLVVPNATVERRNTVTYEYALDL